MRDFDEITITEAVLASVHGAPDVRVRKVSEALVRHLHAFIREVEPTEAEWERGIRFLTETGHLCSNTRQEFILLSDALGVSMLVDAINHRLPGGATETTVFGPFYVKPPRYPTLWEACVNAIVYQQVSIHAAGAILRRVIERLAVSLALGAEGLYAFPGAQTLVDADPEELRRLGLSINKVTSLRVVARALLDGELNEMALTELATPELMAALTEHRGIGPWTAAVIALRGFGRLDLFPMNDSGVARSVRDLAGRTDVDVEALLARLGNQRGMLYYHLLLGRLAARGDVELAAVPSGS